MRAFVTGTAGFIGFHLARRLLEDGHTVTGYDGLTDYYDVALKRRRHAILDRFERFTPVIARLEDADALTAAASEARPDAIVHLAAQAGVRYSLENPKAYLDANLVGSWNVLEAARLLAPRHLLLASTSSVYGSNETVPFAEVHRADAPMTFYAASKKAMEAMAHSYAHLHGLPTTAFRFFTVYGPWGRPDMALFKFVDAALNGRPIDVYGQGRMARDFTYIDDLIEAIVRLIDVPPCEDNRAGQWGVQDTLSPAAPFRVVNIGGGHPTGLLAFIETLERVLGRPIEKRMLPMQAGDMVRTYASADLLQALTGYTPDTPLEDGVRAFVDWYRAEYAAPELARTG